MINIKPQQNENGSYDNIICEHHVEGWFVLPDELKPEHFPFFDIMEMSDGIISSVRDGDFPSQSAEERRREAYETSAVISYGGELITVDQARAICMEYQFENTERGAAILAELTEKITAAKEAIRAANAD